MKTLQLVRNIALGTLISLAAGTAASAQQGCGGGQGRGMYSEEKSEQCVERLKVILELTPDQEAKIKELQKKHAAEAEAHQAKMKEERLKRREAHTAEMKAILTPEQFAKFEALQEDRGPKDGKGSKNGKGQKNKNTK